MAQAEQIEDLLLHWEELREQGQTISPEELCGTRSDLVEEVRRRIRAVEAICRVPNGSDFVTEAFRPVGEPCPRPAGPPHLPGFEILGELGQGGMGVVYKARQVALDRLVAIKMILSGMYARPQEVARFETEAGAVAHLHHPNIVQIYQFGEADGCPYLVLEFVDGTNLAAQLKGRPLPPRLAAQIAEPLAQAVQYAHQRGIIHRDLKPANILLSEVSGPSSVSDGDGQRLIPKITDFGLAKRLGADAGQTQTGTVMGTPNYMAPEQAAGRTRDVGPATDVYALGAILYEMLTGRPPFTSAHLLDILEQVRSQEPVSPRHWQPDIPRDLEVICLKCLQKDPSHRYASAQELADDLHRFLSGELIHARSFTLVDRLSRVLNRTRDVVELRDLAAYILLIAPVPFLGQLVAFLIARHSPSYGMISILTLLGTVLVVMILAYLGERRWSTNPQSSTTVTIWSIRLAQVIGMVLILFVSYQLTPPGQSWDPLVVYPYWSVMTGVTFFGMGSHFWGRLYLLGSTYFALGVLMPWFLEWGPLLLSLMVSVTLASISLHAQQMARQAAESS